jgi:predicted peptidase
MRRLAALVLFLALSVAPALGAEVRDLVFPLPDGGRMLYGLSVPDGYTSSRPRPLVLALHPGGQRMQYYGSAYTRLVVLPAVSNLDALIVAPDCTWSGWTDPAAERAVMTLLDHVIREYAVDKRRVLVTGFSMGGRGTWFMAAHHRDFFTAAIPMAASTDEPLESLGTIPTYVIHSRRDQVVPFAPAERMARELSAMGRPVRFEALSDPAHFEMVSYVPALRKAVEWIASRWGAARN